MKNKSFYQICKISAGLSAAVLVPSTGWACACGCDVFDVATSSMFPTGPGGMVFLNYDYQDQNQNWSGTSSAPASHNDDKEIKTDFFSLGLQYFFNYSWGIQVELPYDYRSFTTKIGPGNIVTRDWSQFGDLRIEGVYTGFFPDLSAGINLGLKLPTGSHTFDSRVVDRDSQLGTGSTDILMGGFYRNSLTKEWKVGLVRSVGTGSAGIDAGSLSSRARAGFGGWNLLQRLAARPRENYARRANDCFGTDDRRRRRISPSSGVGFSARSASHRESNFTFVR